MDPSIVMMIAVLALIAADIITGIIKSVALGQFSSAEMRKGLLRKSGTIALVLIAYGLQYVAGYTNVLPPELTVVYDGVTIYVILMELASNIENIITINPELAGDKLKGLFGIGTKEEEHDVD